MPVKIDATSVQDHEIARRLEASVNQCLNGRSDSDERTVTIRSRYATWYEVVVQGRALKRERLFLQGGDQIVEEIRAWVSQYLPPNTN